MPDMKRFNKYEKPYQQNWEKFIGTPNRILSPAAKQVVDKILHNYKRYKEISKITAVPWEMIGIIHYLEASCDFSKHLHNGDPLSARTVQVPKGRPEKGNPPFTWEESALDALKGQDLMDIPTLQWTIPFMLYILESYNGFGYRSKGINSPYLWCGTSLYTSGKYVRDGVYDPYAVSKQVGAVIILDKLLEAGLRPGLDAIDDLLVPMIPAVTPDTRLFKALVEPITEIPYVPSAASRIINVIVKLFGGNK